MEDVELEVYNRRVSELKMRLDNMLDHNRSGLGLNRDHKKTIMSSLESLEILKTKGAKFNALIKELGMLEEFYTMIDKASCNTSVNW